MNDIVDWIRLHQLPCYIKDGYGTECPSCGIQSAFILLLEGNLNESIDVYPALLPLLTSILFAIIYKIFKKNWIEKVLIILMISTVVLILANFLMKRLMH